MSPLRYIATLLASSLLLLVVAFGAAFSADPAHIFRMPAAYAEIARLLHAGTPVGDLDSPRHRLINRALIAGLTHPHRSVILGSSRIQTFSPATAGWPDALNLAVEGGDLGDHLYLYGLLRERDLIPERVIIAVDPYIFSPQSNLLSRNGKQSAARLVASKLDVGCIDTPTVWARFSWLPEVLTLDYLIESTNSLQAKLRGQTKQVAFAPDPELRSSGFIKQPDGSVVFSTEIRDRSRTTVDDYAQTVLDHPVGRGLAFGTLDDCMTDVFRAFVELLEHDGAEVVLAMLPYHPEAFALLKADNQTLPLSEEFLIKLGAERSVPIVGSYDPAHDHCTAEEFFDMHHPKVSCIQRILGTDAGRGLER